MGVPQNLLNSARGFNEGNTKLIDTSRMMSSGNERSGSSVNESPLDWSRCIRSCRDNELVMWLTNVHSAEFERHIEKENQHASLSPRSTGVLASYRGLVYGSNVTGFGWGSAK